MLYRILILSEKLSMELSADEAYLFAEGITHLKLLFYGFCIATVAIPENAELRILVEKAFVDNGVLYKKYNNRKEASEWLVNL